ncbi:MAG: hypothetical protein ABI689_09450 [Thermoanaerobaculia bacterium]
MRPDLLDLSPWLSAAGRSSLDDRLSAQPLPFVDYLAFMSRWSDKWVSLNGQREPDHDFNRPFEL